jgi:hypothetical protein
MPEKASGKQKWTLPPWEIYPKLGTLREPYQIHANGVPIAVVLWDDYMDDADTEPLANARLIAASPALYEALRELLALEDEPLDGTTAVSLQWHTRWKVAVKKAQALLEEVES